MVRNFETFQVDHWYVYTGECRSRGKGWNYEGEMDFVLARKAFKCVNTTSPQSANFDTPNSRQIWNWSVGFDDWIEVKDPKKEYILQKGEKYYIKNQNEIETTEYSERYIDGQQCFALINSKEEVASTTDQRVFQVGDRIKVVKVASSSTCTWGSVHNRYLGKELTITRISDNGNIQGDDPEKYWIPKESIELVNQSSTILGRIFKEHIMDKQGDIKEEDLCKYCPLPEESRGARSAQVNCEGRFCGEAHERYLEDKGTKKEITFTEPNSETIQFKSMLIKKEIKFNETPKGNNPSFKPKLIKNFKI